MPCAAPTTSFSYWALSRRIIFSFFSFFLSFSYSLSPSFLFSLDQPDGNLHTPSAFTDRIGLDWQPFVEVAQPTYYSSTSPLGPSSQPILLLIGSQLFLAAAMMS